MANWFECKVTYEKMVDNGTPKRTSEGYLVQGDTYTEIEERLTKELTPFTSLGELIINTIKRSSSPSSSSLIIPRTTASIVARSTSSRLTRREVSRSALQLL